MDRLRRGQPRGGPQPRRGILTRLLLMLAVAALAATVIVLAMVPQDHVHVVEPGRFTIEADIPEGPLAAGPLTVTIDKTFRTVEIREGTQTVWRNAPGTAFLTAARATLDVQDHRGYFWPDAQHDETFANQTVTEVESTNGAVILRGTLAHRGDAVPWQATITPRNLSGAIIEAESSDPSVDTLALVTARNGGAVRGLGAQFARSDLSGRTIPIIVREQGVGRGSQPLTLLADVTNKGAGGNDQMTYAAWSSFIVTDKLRTHGVRLDPAEPVSHAFAAVDTQHEDRVVLEVWASRLRAELTSAATPLELLEQQHAGRERPGLPSWTSEGAVIGLQGGTDEVRRQVADLRAAGTELSAVWLQDWSGRRTTSFGDRLWWTWQLDEERYPEWGRLVEDLAAEGIRTTTYVNPWLVDAAGKGDDRIRNLWAEAAEQGFLVRNKAGDAYLIDQGGFEASLIDLTNPEARQWYSQVIAEEVLGKHGVAGFMADFGEGLPFDAVLASGKSRLEHNRWPLHWAQVVREACLLAGLPDCVTWFRSGSLGMDEWAPLFWAGDQMVDWSEQDGLRSALWGMLAAGVSGWPLVHSDVGGYTSINAVVRDYVRSAELLARWAEFEAFGVFMRTHEGNRPDENVQVSSTPQTREQFAAATQIYAALAAYRRKVVAEASGTGVPALRPMWVMAPGTPAAE
ncbi:MAG TPA: alpha-glucosidase, partial [Intrasporangiaceae bacterium]|nr:alpha-glucosidase [Intrasporangiaceae bacterium]